MKLKTTFDDPRSTRRAQRHGEYRTEWISYLRDRKGWREIVRAGTRAERRAARAAIRREVAA